MASKRKSPSFEIPDAVRQAGQSGWVYRTGQTPMKPKTTRPSAQLPMPPRSEPVTIVEIVETATPTLAEPPQAAMDLPLTPSEQDKSAMAAVAPAEQPLAIAETPEPMTELVGVAVNSPVGPPESTIVTRVSTFETANDAPVAARAGCALTRYLVGLGLEMLVAPIVVPLYLLSGVVCRAAE